MRAWPGRPFPLNVRSGTISDMALSTPLAGAAAVLAATVVLGAGVALVSGLGLEPEGTDLVVFARYGDAVSDGALPYREVAIEYPPGALAAIVPPALGGPEPAAYAERFTVLMFVLTVLLLGVSAATLATLGVGNGRAARALGLIAATPLLLGPILLKRFDVLPALLVAGALALALRRRFGASAFVLGLAAAVKLYPVVVLPLLLAGAAREGRRRVAHACTGFVLGLAAPVVPFLLLSPSGLASSVQGQLTRKLQVETPLASLLLLAHTVAGVGVGLVSEAHTFAIGGSRGSALGALATLCLLVGLAVVWARAPRLVATHEDTILGWTAAVALVVVGGHVLSPQYLVWLLPLVPLLAGRAGVAAAALLAIALLLTNVWFPDRYWDATLRLDAGSIALLVARNATLVGLVVVVVARVLCVPRAGDAASMRTAG